MKLRVKIVVLVIGLLFMNEGESVESPLKKSKHLSRSFDASKGNAEEEELQEQMDDLWKRYTREQDEPPSIVSEFLNSTIIGKTMETIKGRVIYAFQGFRFGKEPTLKTRFKPPVPERKHWDGDTFVANHIGFKCPQWSMIGNNPSGNEDCLFLNVYTPFVPPAEEGLPVMFFIYGGAFTTGDASMYLPTKLLDHDVILVTIHYRLGAFGFFSLDNEDAPGNTALYDMVEALRWVQDCISDFGGDPEKVTIFGESAGSVSVNYLMLIEQARGMFRSVIGESGSALDHWAIDEDPHASAVFIAETLECPTDNDDDLFDCVVRKEVSDLINAENKLVSTDRQQGLMGFRGAAPIIQTSSYDDLLVTEHPNEYFRKGNFAKVPFMTGANKQEGSYVMGVMYGEYYSFHHLNDNATYMKEQMVQDILHSLGYVDDTFALANLMTMQFCYGVDMGDFDAAAPCLIDMSGVLFLKAGSWQTSNLHSYFSDQKTFYYSFEFESDDCMYTILFGSSPPFDAGVTHSDELMYLFAMPAIMDTPEQILTMNRMTKLWTNFAIYGDPTPDEEQEAMDALGVPKWLPFKFEDHHYMLMANDFVVEQEFTDRWTVSMDEIRGKTEEKCTGLCADYKDQRDAYMTSMIVFIVACFVATLGAVYFFFKARS